MSLNDILKNMNSELFEDSVQESINNIGEPIYQEEISPSIAGGLLEPEDFDPTCKYYIITEQEKMVLLKYNDHAPVTEVNPEGEELTEYVLDDVERVKSFAEMRNDITDPISRSIVGTSEVKIVNKDKPFHLFIVLSIIGLLGFIGLAAFIWYILFKLKAML